MTINLGQPNCGPGHAGQRGDGTVEGTNGNDLINVAYAGDPEGDRIDAADARLAGAAPNDDLVYAYGGNDTVVAGEGHDKVYGGTGNDSLSGGVGNDTLWGEAGNDVLDGGVGNDVAYGGDEDDTIRGGQGADQIYGGTDQDTVDYSASSGAINVVLDGAASGGDAEGDTLRGVDAVIGTNHDDRIVGFDNQGTGAGRNQANSDFYWNALYGGAGNDFVDGRGGDDTVEGGAGDDTVLGGSGNGVVRGDDGDDRLLGGIGADTVHGGEGDDVIDSSDGGIGTFDNPYPPLARDANPNDDRDTVFGGVGNDTIRSGDDADLVSGGDGDDHVDGGIDNDTLHGDAGNDTVVSGEGSDVITGDRGGDTIYGGLDPRFPDALNIPDDRGDLVTNNGADTIYGGDGDDTIFGLDDDDTIFGGAGNDRVDGGVDDDSIVGDSGDDSLAGGQGNDTVSGDSGNDVIAGGVGTDTLYGGDDQDVFLGGNGGDVVDGGSGGVVDFDTLDLTGSGADHIRYTSADREDGIVYYKDGTTSTFEEIENVIPCFTPGTMIATPRGEKPVEELREGDRVIPRDNGIQEIRWVGRKEVSGRLLVGSPHLRPVLVKAGSLGHGLPERDMLVSPNHRILVANDRTQLYFEESEVLAAAKHMVGTPGIHVVDAMSVSYIHFMFDRHEVVLSNGAWTESFQPGDWSLKGIGNAQRNELMELFPELKTREGVEGYHSARKSLRRHEARLLVR